MYYYNNEVPPQQGWICPNCGSVMSPNMMWCPFCSGEKKTYTTTTLSVTADGISLLYEPQTEREGE